MNQVKKIITDPVQIYAGTSILKEFANDDELFNSFSNIVIIVDNNTYNYCLPTLLINIPRLSEAIIVEVSSGELNKNINSTIEIWKSLSEINLDRNALIINLGGGVITDMGAFAASTFKRGIPFINIPTTLLAMVDASFGGKTGIDLMNYKNQIGTFATPKAVIIDTIFLSTLSKEQLMNGIAEVIKHSLIADKTLWKKLRKTIFDTNTDWEDLIIKNIKIKHKIVKNDPFEKGVRKLLNFGHTIGHAIESYSMTNGFRRLMHGEAIVIGMICETFLSVNLHKIDTFQANEICSYLFLNFKTYPFPKKDIHIILEIMKQDKKNKEGMLNFTLLRDIGEATFNNYVDVKQITKSLEYYLQYV